MNSRAKGKTYEREIARYLREQGYNARRGQQYKGGADSPDVVGLTGWHIECKRTERFNLYAALKQALRDKADGEKALVIHRKNNEPSVAILLLDDFMEALKCDEN